MSARGALVARAALAALLAAGPSWAQARGALGAPETGVDAAPRRGTFVEAGVGYYTALGGSAGVANGQPSLAMTLGTELSPAFALFLSAGIGAASASCYEPLAANGDCPAADAFGAFYLEAGASAALSLGHRTRLGLKLLGGLTQLAPGPVADLRDRARPKVPDTVLGPHVGGALSLDYDTRLDHFAIGVDLAARLTFAARPDTGNFTLASLALLPRVRYVF